MAKSFCNGCKYWKQYRTEPFSIVYDAGIRFHYCDKYGVHEYIKRKNLCNGQYKEK